MGLKTDPCMSGLKTTTNTKMDPSRQERKKKKKKFCEKTVAFRWWLNKLPENDVDQKAPNISANEYTSAGIDGYL